MSIILGEHKLYPGIADRSHINVGGDPSLFCEKTSRMTPRLGVPSLEDIAGLGLRRFIDFSQ